MNAWGIKHVCHNAKGGIRWRCDRKKMRENTQDGGVPLTAKGLYGLHSRLYYKGELSLVNCVCVL
jgi:hypothetical protein